MTLRLPVLLIALASAASASSAERTHIDAIGVESNGHREVFRILPGHLVGPQGERDVAVFHKGKLGMVVLRSFRQLLVTDAAGNQALLQPRARIAFDALAAELATKVGDPPKRIPVLSVGQAR